jgi:transposase-like protein
MRRRSDDRGRRRLAHGGLAAAQDGAGTRRCPYCSGRALGRFGRTPQGAQRWHCRGCGRKHQAVTATALAGLHQPGKFACLVEDMLGPEPSSCRRLARRLALDKSTVWKWRQKASGLFAAIAGAELIEPIVKREMVVRESRKASREWVNHDRDPATYPAPDRLRWVDYRRRGLSSPDHLPRYRIVVGIAVDGSGRRSAAVGADHPALGCASSSASSTVDPSRACATAPPLWPAVSSMDDALARTTAAFRAFIDTFRGPATRHLPAYVAWFVARADDRRQRAGATIGGSPALAYSAASAIGLLGWLVQLA